MLSIFPSLLAYEGFTPFLLRITIGSVFIFWAYKEFNKKKSVKHNSLYILKFIIGISFILGIYTQLSALISIIILGIKLFNKFQNKNLFNDGVNYYFILFIISICLLISGSGFIAFDLPL